MDTNRTRVAVAAAVIARAGTLLLCQRPFQKRHGGLWEFPGGKVDNDESLAEAVQRELREELGVRVLSVGESIFVKHDPGSPYEIHFLEAEISGEPEALEHEQIRWSTLEEAASLPLAPSDHEFVQHLLRGSPSSLTRVR